MKALRSLASLVAFASASSAQDASRKQEPGLVISVLHSEDAKCEAHEKGRVCREETHWRWRIKGQDYDDAGKLRDLIKKHAETGRTDKKRPDLSEAGVRLRGEGTAPYGRVQRAMVLCADAGIYKIELSLERIEFAQPMPEKPKDK